MDRNDSSSLTGTLGDEMEAWFRKATVAERDALSALQLLYWFQGDNLGNQWWIHLQALGFKHNGTTYELPKTAPNRCRCKSYSALELYQEMDRFAIPQLTSPYPKFPDCPPPLPLPQSGTCTTTEEQEAQAWWQTVRDVLVFKRFRSQIEGFQLHHLPPVGTSTGSDLNTARTKNTNNKRRMDSKDAGAELFMQKTTTKGKKRGKIAAGYDYTSSSLSKVRFPSIRDCVMEVPLDSLDIAHVENTEALLAQDFPKWKFQTVMNHSLLCYGVGSKRRLLNLFADELEADGESVIVMDGFHRDVTIEGILDLISNVWLRGEAPPSYDRYDVHAGYQLSVRPFGTCNYPSCGEASVVQRAGSISRALARLVNERQRGYYLIVQGIDGVGLRNASAQEALATLVSCSTTIRGLNALRLVASVDHVNGPALLWDTSTCAQFSWIWKPVHTRRPYVEELLHGAFTDEISTRVAPRHSHDSSDHVEHNAIFTVLASLAPRLTEALQQLAGLQANQLADSRQKNRSDPSSASSSSSWVPYKTLFRQCQRKCIVHGDEQLRRFLQELKDHGVVEQSNGDDADVRSYRIPHTAQTLKDILEFSHS